MKRIRLTISYDGTNYRGWQIQSNGITIEEVLNKTLSDLLGESIAVIGASRTDSGVHAEGNVAVFDTNNRMASDKICFALNQRLPEDIRIQRSEEVPADWHPRKQNCVKTYEYRILNCKIDVPTKRLYTHFCYYCLDVEKMKQAAEYFLGEHDFKSFCTDRKRPENTVRMIYGLCVSCSEDHVITIRVSGSGFLYNMVRIIAGTLIKVGMGTYSPEYIEEILDSKDRKSAGQKAPAKGLTLISLEYEKEPKPMISGENKDWSYRLNQRSMRKNGTSYLVVLYCVESEYEAMMTRVIHQAARNGARYIYLMDQENLSLSDQKKEVFGDQNPDCAKLWDGRQFGFYTVNFSHTQFVLERATESMRQPNDIRLKSIEAEEAEAAIWLEFYDSLLPFVLNSEVCTASDVLIYKNKPDHKVVWFFMKEQPVGIAQFVLRREEGCMEIDAIGVMRKFEGEQTDRKALRACIDFAYHAGMKSVRITVAENDVPALPLCQEEGFEEKSRKSWFVSENSLFLKEIDVDTHG